MKDLEKQTGNPCYNYNTTTNSIRLEKQIEEAAQAYSKSRVDPSVAWGSFVDGATSEVAKEYWLQKLSEEFESKPDDSYIEVIEVVNKVLKSDMAKEYWQKNMYTKEDIKSAWEKGYNKAVSSINEDRYDEEDNAPTFEQWFNNLSKTKL